MAETLKKEDIASRLDQKTNEINAHLDSLKTGAEEVKRDLLDEMRRRPLIFIAGGLAIGLLLGLLLRGGRRKPKNVAEAYTDLVERYMDSVADEAAKLMKKGATADEAIHHVVRDRGPIFVYAPGGADGEKKEKSSIFRDALGAALIPLISAGAHYFSSVLEGRPDGGHVASSKDKAGAAKGPSATSGVP